tara:strand:- start:1373 stop:1483 length:111 start_codon:yes stop_codon:yes gene_type:complete
MKITRTILEDLLNKKIDIEEAEGMIDYLIMETDCGK